MLGDAHAQRAAEAALQRLLDFVEMRQRQPDFLAAGDHDAVGIEQPEARPASRSGWRPDRASCARRARRRRDRPAPEAVAPPAAAAARFRWRVRAPARSADRAARPAFAAGGGTLAPSATLSANGGLDLAAENRRQRRALRDQFGLGLLDQLVLVDLEEIDAEQRQQQHAGQNDKNDRLRLGRHFWRGVGRVTASFNATPRSVPV